MKNILTAAELAEELGVTTEALRQWRNYGSGPIFIKQGKFIRYRRQDVDKWIEASLHSRTDERVIS